MRSVPAGSFDRLSAPVALWQAWRRCSQGKRRKADVATFDLDADLHVLDLSDALRAGTWAPGPCRLKRIEAPKPRCVVVAPVADRVVHQAMVGELGPHYARSFVHHTYGCLTGRGPHRAVLTALGWMRRHRFRLALDVRSYFATVRHDLLLGLYAHRLRDRRTLDLLQTVITAGGRPYLVPWVRALAGTTPETQQGRGLSVGSYLSHFSGALYLDGLDHHLKRVLGVPAALRYMDDLLLFDDDPDALLRARDAAAAWLSRERDLSLEDPGARPRDNRRLLVFLGYEVDRGGVRPSAKLWRNARFNLRRAASRSPAALQRVMASYSGLMAF